MKRYLKHFNIGSEESRGHQVILPSLVVLVVVMLFAAFGSLGPTGTVVSGDTSIEPITMLSDDIIVQHENPTTVSKITMYTTNDTAIGNSTLEGSDTLTVTPPNDGVGNYTVKTTYKNGTTSTTKIRYTK